MDQVWLRRDALRKILADLFVAPDTEIGLGEQERNARRIRLSGKCLARWARRCMQPCVAAVRVESV